MKVFYVVMQLVSMCLMVYFMIKGKDTFSIIFAIGCYYCAIMFKLETMEEQLNNGL